MIEKNVGRDIAKYFDGGYQMENSNGQKPITHNYLARQLVEKLAIGYLGEPAEQFEARCISMERVNRHTAVFKFKAKESVRGV